MRGRKLTSGASARQDRCGIAANIATAETLTAVFGDGGELMSQPKREGATGGALRVHSARNIARSSGGRKNDTSLLAWIQCAGELDIFAQSG
jgi:hypothetical protein